MKKVIIFFSIFLTACSLEQAVRSFPHIENLEMNEIVLSDPLNSLGSMFTTDDYLVIFQRSMPEMFFSYYSLHDLNFISRGGKQGQGPDDFIRPSTYFFNTKGNEFSLIDRSFIKHVDIEREQFKVVKKESLKTPYGLPPNNYFKIDDDVYCIYNVDINKPYEFIIFDNQGVNPVWISPYPNWANVREGSPLFTYGKFVVTNPALKRFLAFYTNFRRVRMFDSKGILQKDILVEFPFKFPQYEEKVESKMSAYYYIPYSDDKYIYVICYNAKTSETNELTELQIWNWDAEPIAILYLDKGLRQFTISKKENRLYATNPLNDENEVSSKIFWCDLPTWLNQ